MEAAGTTVIHLESSASHVFCNIGKYILRKRENHCDGLKLRHNQEGVRVRRMHHVSDVDQPKPDSAANRRSNSRIRQLEFRVVDRRLIRLNRSLQLTHQSFLSVELLL